MPCCSTKWFFHHAWLRLPVLYGLVAFLYCVFGWGAMKGVLPDIVWTFVDEHVNRGIMLILVVLILRQVFMLLISIYWYVRIRINGNVISDVS